MSRQINILLVGNCILDELGVYLKERGYNVDFTYIGNPLSLLYSDKIPDGLAEKLQELQIEDRLEMRSLVSQFEGISAQKHYDLVFLNYYHEQTPILRNKSSRYFLHLNFEMIKLYEHSEVGEWIDRHFDVVQGNPAKYLHRFVGLIYKIRANFPEASIIIVNKFEPICSLGPIPQWYCTPGRPFDEQYLATMEEWINLLMEKVSGLFLFHTENILINYMDNESFNPQFLFPNLLPPSSTGISFNYIRDLEHPSHIFMEKMVEYAELLINHHLSGDSIKIRDLCNNRNRDLWNELKEKEYVSRRIPVSELKNMITNPELIFQKVGLENSIFLEDDEAKELYSVFKSKLEHMATQTNSKGYFISLWPNFRTVITVRPRRSLLPIMEIFLDIYKSLNCSYGNKNYYLSNILYMEDYLRTESQMVE